MTILDKARKGGTDDSKGEGKPSPEKKDGEAQNLDKGKNETADSSQSQVLNAVESQFKNLMSEFQANTGFSVETGEQPVDTMIELLSSPGVNVSIVLLLSFIRHCINHGLKKDITLKIGYNKPPSIPMNFAVNEELLEDIYPGNVVEIN